MTKHTCPNCKNKVVSNIGKNTCPVCGIYFQVGAMYMNTPNFNAVLNNVPNKITNNIPEIKLDISINNERDIEYIQQEIIKSMGVPKTMFNKRR